MRRHYKFWIYNYLSFLIPFGGVKRALLKWCGVVFHGRAHIGYNVKFSGDGEIVFDDGIYIAGNSHLNVSGVLHCGRQVLISDGVSVSVGKDGRLLLGNDVKIGPSVICAGTGSIVLGDRSECWHRSIIMANGMSSVSIGHDCKIAHMVSLKTTTHEITPAGPCIGGDVVFKDIVIGAGSWLCAGVVVLPGVTIARKTLVAAGAVVTRDTRPCSLVAGVPAKEVRIYQE